MIFLKNSPLGRYRLEFGLVPRVGLHPQTGCEDELADGCRKARKECVEWLKRNSKKREISNHFDHTECSDEDTDVKWWAGSTYEVSGQDTVRKLSSSQGHEKDHEAVDELESGWSVGLVGLPEQVKHL